MQSSSTSAPAAEHLKVKFNFPECGKNSATVSSQGGFGRKIAFSCLCLCLLCPSLHANPCFHSDSATYAPLLQCHSTQPPLANTRVDLETANERERGRETFRVKLNASRRMPIGERATRCEGGGWVREGGFGKGDEGGRRRMCSRQHERGNLSSFLKLNSD